MRAKLGRLSADKQGELFRVGALGLSPRRLRALNRRLAKKSRELHRNRRGRPETKAEREAAEQGGTYYRGSR